MFNHFFFFFDLIIIFSSFNDTLTSVTINFIRFQLEQFIKREINKKNKKYQLVGIGTCVEFPVYNRRISLEQKRINVKSTEFKYT